MTRLRSRFLFHAELVPFKQTYRTLVKYKDELTITYVAGDQTPHKDEINFWTTFLNRDTAFFLGTEKIARALDYAVVFLDIQRAGRGHYEVSVNLITDDPASMADHAITKTFTHKLEQAINRHPDNWLWSHRRWKYSRENHQTVN
jgi:KDO2-lipid IV(A) lauroyltransferase